MVHACLPRLTDEETDLLFGGDPAEAADGDCEASSLVHAAGAAALVE